jgi:glycosyltransferase involved in cell wall biosynthesis
VMRCVGAAPSFTLPGVRTEVLPWSEQNESDLIRTFDLGVMPLADDSFSRGKCGLKLIQYMASGVPSIGERLGANTDIISDGVNGFLASGEEEYVRKVDLLLSSLDLRERLGRNGRSTVERSYSLQVRSRDFCEVFERCRLEGQP